MPMVDGIMHLAHNAIKGLSIRARTVYAGEEFEYEEGLTPVLKHKPDPAVDKRTEAIRYVYAIARQPGQMEADYLVFDKAMIERYRGYSRARSGPWETHYEQMAHKAVIKQLLKRMPKAVAALPDVPTELERYEMEPMSEVDDYVDSVVTGGMLAVTSAAMESNGQQAAMVDAGMPADAAANPDTGEMPMPVDEAEPDDTEPPF